MRVESADLCESNSVVPLLPQATTASANNALRALCESVRQHCEAGNLEDTIGLAQSVSATVFQVFMAVYVSYHCRWSCRGRVISPVCHVAVKSIPL